MSRFVNPETREAFLHVICDTEDPFEMVKQWSEVGNGSAVEMLAKELRKDFRDEFDPDSYSGFDELMMFFAQRGLCKICWEQLAQRLLELCEPKKEREEEQPGQEGGQQCA